MLKTPSASGQSGEEEKRRNPSEGSRTETRRRLFSKENSSEKEEAGEEWEGSEGATPPRNLLLRPLSRGGGNDRGASEPCSSFHLKRIRTRRGAEHSSTSLAAVARLVNLAEEAASVNHPDSRYPDADAAEAVCATPMEEVGAESQSQPSDDPDRLALVLIDSKRLKLVAHPPDAHPEGGEVEMVTETPAVPVMVPAEVAPGETIRPYAELEDKLKQIPPGSPDIMPLAQMFDTVETLVSGLRGMAQQHDLFADLLRTTDYMKIFASRHKETKSREESTADRLHEAADEMARLREEELEREFAAEREELEAEYQKQVDDTFIFGYQCCMKKNGIKRTCLQFLRVEKKLHDKPAP
ncbi:hypothetical protein CK203_053486 [Vitis vinifera]|uniref:Uncharacterized protein n=1 Tax=Vitis vinifera TaxID=29760 RepID=A0A438JDZ3_VITVI|nr:hypothetical protein CK203_053486 [Vitis vinifera]